MSTGHTTTALSYDEIQSAARRSKVGGWVAAIVVLILIITSVVAVIEGRSPGTTCSQAGQCSH